MLKKSILAISMLLAGCGQEETKRPAIVDEALADYVARFEAEVGVSAEGIDVIFEDLEEDIVGLCTVWRSGAKKITIDPEYWNSETETQKEELMFHELGHCAMGLGHDEGVTAVGRTNCPNSVMYPYTFEYCYARFRDYYISELISKKGSGATGPSLAGKVGCSGHRHK